MKRERALAIVAVVAAISVGVTAQTVGYIVAEYLTPEFTASPTAPSSIVVAGREEPGPRMVVTGRTLIGDKPVAGVSIYVFHTDIQGNYSKETTDNRVGELHPSLHGALRTDAQGRYQFETIRPAGYDGGPSHVHYVVKAEGYEPLLLVLQFMDDPIAVKTLNAKRKYWDELAFREGPCKSRPDCILTQPVTIDPQNVAHVVRDIQMVRKN